VDWEENLVALLGAAGIKAYPLVAPLEADKTAGHVVYSLINDQIHNSFEGWMVDSVLVQIDARAERYPASKKLLEKCLEVLRARGKSRQVFMVEREEIDSEYNPTLDLYRRVVYIHIDPDFVLLEPINNRSFDASFSGAFA